MRLLLKFISATIIAMSMLLLNSCEEDEVLDTPGNIKVSKGTYMGIVHLEWDAVPGANYDIERREPNGNRTFAGHVSDNKFDDYGSDLYDNYIVPGEHYAYRIKSTSQDIDDSGFSEFSEEGWAYEIKPIKFTVTKVGDDLVFSWKDPNCTAKNFLYYDYYIAQTEESGYERNFRYISHKTDSVGEYTEYMASDYYLNSTYRIKASYYYVYHNLGGECTEYIEYETDKVAVTDTSDSGGDDNVETIDFTWNDRGSFGETGSNGINYINTKEYDNRPYVAILDNPAMGKPHLYEYNNEFYEPSTRYPEGLQQNTFTEIDFAVKSSVIYIAGVADSAFVYSYDAGVWSQNLAKNNFGYSEKLQEISIETDGSNIYVAMFTDDKKLVVKKWEHDTVWTDMSEIENNVSISELYMKQFNNKVYMYYVTFDGNDNTILHIKHIDNNSWVTDLNWNQNYLMNIDLTLLNGTLYFTAGSSDMDNWQGGVFKVSTVTSAENIVTEDNTWLLAPSSISVNLSGDVVVVYAKMNTETNMFNPYMALYRSGKWSKISGDYSKYVYPATVNVIGTEYYFIFGDGNNLSSSYYPNKLRVNILTEK